jgi:menaquinone-dependent protoporphyrinogen oxidase
MEPTTQTDSGSPHILIVYSSVDGHTKKISQKLKEVIEEHDHNATLVDVDDIDSADLSEFGKVVIGASVRYGKHSPLIFQFIEKNRSYLDERPNAFFSVNVVARKPEKKAPESNPYLQKFLKKLSWKPRHLEVIAGKIDYPSYRFIDRIMIQMIMWMTKGPTDPTTVIEYTDWAQVDAFGKKITEM